MCGADPTCNCPKRTKTLRVNFAGTTETKFQGRDVLVVPLVMAISSVVMNGALVPEEELFAESWNGVPVTIRHPENNDGSFLSANTPESIAEWCIGRVFNAKVKEGKLCADAYIDLLDAERLAPGLIKMIRTGKPVDVSTGYFADVEEAQGTSNGDAYEAIHRNLRPDHLAILPDEDGACNWEDGCGVRANKKRSLVMKLKDKLLGKPKAKKNAEGDVQKPAEDELATMADQIIGCEDSPFTEADKEGLCKMSSDSLKALSAMYSPEQEETMADEPADDSETKQAEADKGEEKAMKGNALSEEDKLALNHARKTFAAHKSSLVSKIVANTKISKADAEKLTVDALEVIANGIAEPAPTYEGRALPTLNSDESKPLVEAMAVPSLVDTIRNRKQKA